MPIWHLSPYNLAQYQQFPLTSYNTHVRAVEIGLQATQLSNDVTYNIVSHCLLYSVLSNLARSRLESLDYKNEIFYSRIGKRDPWLWSLGICTMLYYMCFS